MCAYHQIIAAGTILAETGWGLLRLLSLGGRSVSQRGGRGDLTEGAEGATSRKGRKGRPHGRGGRMWVGVYTPPTHPESLPLDSVPCESRAVTGHAPGSRGKPRAIAPCSPCFAQSKVSWSFVRHYLPSSPSASVHPALCAPLLRHRCPSVPGRLCFAVIFTSKGISLTL